MWRLLSLEGRVWRDGRSLPLARPSDVVPLGRVGTGAPFSSSKCYDAALQRAPFMDGYLDRVEMSTLGLPTAGYFFPQAGASAPGWEGGCANPAQG